MSTHSLFLFTIVILLPAIGSAASAPTSTSTSSFTLQPLNLQDAFSLQSLNNHSKYPYVTPRGEIFLTQDPSDSFKTGNLYNVGRITYMLPLCFKNKANQVFSFNTTFSFAIITSTKYNESGDGIAFLITTDKAPPKNSTGRFFGMMPERPQDRHQRFMALEFDTFQNLQAEIMDPSASHIGIDISNVSSIKPILNTADRSHPLYLYNNYTITAWMSYDAPTQLIQVWATNRSYDERPAEPILRITQNLSQTFENYTELYAGIIAASGNNSQASILYSWSFSIDDQSRHQKGLLLKLLVIAALLLVLLLIVIVASRMILRRRERDMNEHKRRAAIEDAASVSVHRHRYNELRRATHNFSREQEIGKGGFSSVYKGVLRDDSIVAIKKMRDGLVDPDIIAREVQIISRIKHRNLLELEGWCYERDEALLVYKYMPKGSLEGYLYGDRRRQFGEELDSNTRFNIIVGVAASLEYLHNGLEECILHRDVKAANVLLTDTMEAKLGDFGLARLIAHDEIVTITAMGTPGYVAPEVINTGRVTEKADVYSFGVLALEVACGRRALDPLNPRYSRLVDWVWVHHQNTTILHSLDPDLMRTLTKGMASVSEDLEVQKWRCVLHLGLLCCQTDPDARPYMSQVHQALKSFTVLPPPSSWTLYPTLPRPETTTPFVTASVLEPQTGSSL